MIANTASIKVRYAETDQMGIVHHSVYIIWFEQSRIELLNSLDMPYASFEAEGYFMPVLAVNCEFFKPVRFGEQVNVLAKISVMPGAAFEISYEVTGSDQTLRAAGSSRHSFMNKEYRAVKPPKRFMEKLKPFFR
jgi:acyl-CoA thioester hydrolase